MAKKTATKKIGRPTGKDKKGTLALYMAPDIIEFIKEQATERKWSQSVYVADVMQREKDRLNK